MTLRKKVPKRAGGRSIWEKGLTSSKFNGQKCEIFTACNNHSTPDYYNFTYVNTDNGFSNQSFENVVIRLEDDNNHPYHNRKFLNLHTIATNNHQYHEEPTTPDTLHNHHTCLQASVNENFMSSFYAKAQTPHEGGSQNHQHTAQPYLMQQPHFYQSYQNQVSTCSSAFDYYQPGPCSANNNNNPLHLWQFLLDLLADQKFKDMISWTGNAWEFKFTQPERVAYLWGKCKSRPRMTYEKLSRGLRYYYRKKIMKKTAGKRYVYEFMQGTHELTSHPLSSVLLLEAFRLPCNTFEPSINSYFEYL